MLEIVNYSKLECNLIILDPPFCFLKEHWDENFPVENEQGIRQTATKFSIPITMFTS